MTISQRQTSITQSYSIEGKIRVVEINNMSIASASAGFNFVSNKYNLHFKVPKLNIMVHIGEPVREVLDSLVPLTGISVSRDSTKLLVKTYPDEMILLSLSTASNYVCGIDFASISSQVPSNLVYTFENKNYLSSYIVDGYIIWIKSANEVKLKESKGIPGHIVSVESLGITVKKVSRQSAKCIAEQIKAINSKCYAKEPEPEPELKWLRSKPDDPKSNKPASRPSQPVKQKTPEEELDSALSKYRSLYKDYTDKCEMLSRRYCNRYLVYLVNISKYLYKDDNDFYQLTPKAYTDTNYVMQEVRKTKEIKVRGMNPRTCECFFENGSKYHYEYRDYWVEERVPNYELLCSKAIVEETENFRRAITRLRNVIDVLEYEIANRGVV